MHCISIVSYSIIINGEPGKKVRPTRGLRQGDPLSPYLFLLCGECISSLMRLATQEGLLEGAKVCNRGPLIYHLMFADDCILFRDAMNRGAHIIKSILCEFEVCFEQCVNFDKSLIYYSSNVLDHNRMLVSQILNV